MEENGRERNEGRGYTVKSAGLMEENGRERNEGRGYTVKSAGLMEENGRERDEGRGYTVKSAGQLNSFLTIYGNFQVITETLLYVFGSCLIHFSQ